jgi:hypothetical protein
MTLAATATLSRGAAAQCCAGYSLATACADVNLTKARWCIQDTVPTGQAALPKEFCEYGDKVISTLEHTFNVPAEGVFEFELDAQTGGAHTGTACNNTGDGVAYDAFVGTAYGAKGFWGYLLALHEAINVWTGMTSSGWPTDWWADHQSAFPNLMDFHVMTTLGEENNDANLLKAAAAQKKRFYPGGDSADPKVVALDNVFALMPNGDGFAGFSNMFALISGDGVRWDRLGVPNPDVKRSEYVVAYMSLAARQSVLTTLQGPGANGGGEICNGVDDQAGDEPYVCSQARIDQIATAHCSIAANSGPNQDLSRLRGGTYDSIPSGPCGATCPAECACDAVDHCVAPWLGTRNAGGEGGAGGDTGSSPTGGKAPAATGGTASAATGGVSSGSPGSGGNSSTAGALGRGGSLTAVGGQLGKGGSGAAVGGSLGAGGSPASSGGSGFAGSGDQEKSDSSCSCRAVGREERSGAAGIALGAAAVLYLRRSRRKRC